MSKRLVLRKIRVSHTLGTIAVVHNFITKEQLTECTELQNERTLHGKHYKLGTILKEKRYLTDEQIDLILDAQLMARRKKSDHLYGNIALKNQVVTRSELKEALRAQKKNPDKRLGELLLESGAINTVEHFMIMRVQERLKAREAQEAAPEDGEEKEFPLDADTITVGRLKENDIQITDPSVSRRHCQFVKTDQGYRVVNLVSINGVRVNGKLVGSHLLKPGDKILVGDMLMVVEEELPAELPLPEEEKSETAPSPEEEKSKAPPEALKVKYRPRAFRGRQQTVQRAAVLIAAVILLFVIAAVVSRARSPREQTPEEQIAHRGASRYEAVEKRVVSDELNLRLTDSEPAGRAERIGVERIRQENFSAPERFVRREAVGVREYKRPGPDEKRPQKAVLSPEEVKAVELFASVKTSDLSAKQAIYDQLIALGHTCKESLKTWLLARREELMRSLLDKKLVKAIHQMQLYRLNLLEKRFAALTVIADYKEYNKKKGQAEVNGLVREVKLAYNLSYRIPRQKLSKSQKEKLSEFDLTDKYLRKIGADIPEAYDAYIDSLKILSKRSLSFREFALQYGDPETARKNRKVMEYCNQFRYRCTDISAQEWSFIKALNDYRIIMGRVALIPDERLCRATRGHSSDMRSNRYFAHMSPDPEIGGPGERALREGYNEASIGENILRGASSGRGAFSGWYNSAPHHRNMLMIGHMHVGVGQDMYYWTANFGAGFSPVETYDKLLEKKDSKPEGGN